MDQNNTFSKIEIPAMIGAGIGLMVALAQVTGREAHTDVLWYMNMSLNNIADPHWLTRYTHTFLQKPFVSLASNPFDGIVWFWAFLMAAIAVLIYSLHRQLFPKNSIIHAALSVGFFLAFQLHGANGGVPWADLTAALVLLGIVLIYWKISEQAQPAPLWLIALGVAFVIAFKTKETIWIVGILALGLIPIEDGKLNRSQMLVQIKWLGVGLLSGIVAFALLNAIVLSDLLFDFRPINIQTYLNYWISDADYYPGSANWISDGFLTTLPYLFILFIIAGTQMGEDDKAKKLIWTLPFALILFLTLGMVKNTFLVYPRFLFPSQALIAVFIPALFPKENPTAKKKTRGWILQFGIGTGIYLTLYEFIKMLVGRTEINFSDFVTSIFLPACFSVLLLILVFKPKKQWLSTAVPLVLLVALLRPGLFDNIRQFRLTPPEDGFQTRFYPLHEYGDLITPAPNATYWVSSNIPAQTQAFSNDQDTLRTIFDLHFGIETERDQFLVIENKAFTHGIAITGRPTYLFVLNTEGEYLRPLLPDHCTLSEQAENEVSLVVCK